MKNPVIVLHPASPETETKYLTIVNSYVRMVIHYEGSFLSKIQTK